ncbi:MucB/RseB C-terminal domain-containing protein [Solemya velum gill symbiont]|uniref:Negative regulator of sigma E activity n=1 Tax=Solemya velum gill symbiont TaxID=2340 RepID=A0A0B0H5S9_SOVGS|nr:MucB/RseB C-terminal domain-containing protein [Solemya velum gill symbiont]KHF24450.1 negative regulator of sigma E activity [Solemya velum gill symbiont]OOY34939.1 hypothetical protein BOV88_07420 [Solemya velum gill symbiont]OOY37308.1 hypothetical protein BOV89_07905 [Solemya velum gill symbiont]OOY40288.1 hypothetical protein BOV90_04715 [Solemya velum gill symbiont]OOY44338.1 hypothetical protein BOV92_08970 [Solemya velum gill symbiont]
MQRTLISLALTLLLFTPAVAQDEATTLLDRMTQTVRNLNYEGDFVYQTGEVLNAMHIVHSVREGFEKEHLSTLTGPKREIIRDDYTITRLTPDKERPSVSERRRSHLPTLASFDPERLASLYRIEVIGDERVAGRPVTLVAVMPKDAFRYGHRLYLDKETALPLRRVVVDRKGATISQMMFTTIEISEMDTQPQEVSETPVEAVEYDGEWSFDGIPAGFIIELYSHTEPAGQARDHFVFSDGITRLSLYIENGSGGQDNRQTSVGGVGILSTKVDGHKLTVVGEAPLDTLKIFLRSARRNSAGK